MRASQFFLATQKEAPQEAELASHKLMLRAGLIKRLGSGLYSWMPLGLRVLRKVETIVREEMNRAGALELLMPAVQPKELWEETGRWAVFGPQMLKIRDRHERDFCFGPTHEEVITDIARREIRSYKQLPLNFYQIQTKFRDEIRPRFGVMRAREFVMKDGYSFHTSLESLQQTYDTMYQAYSNIFNRLGLKFRAVRADTGAIGGDGSHEFHVLADSGEDALAYCEHSDFAANVELAEALAPEHPRGEPKEPLREVDTPKQTTCEDVAALLGISLQQTVKSIAVVATDEAGNSQFYLLLLRGDHALNEVKAAKVPGLSSFRFASELEIREYLGCPPGFIGPVGVSTQVNVVADRSVAVMSDFVCGANKPKLHLAGVNFGRDLPEPMIVADIRNVVEGDPSPDGKGCISLCRGIEVGHIFQLRTKYTEAMEATYLDENGQKQFMEMGCYGIGVSRIVGAAIEQGNDERGIIFPAAMAPFSVAIAPIGYDKSEAVQSAAHALYDELSALGIDVLLDDRGERPGVMFADLELIGIPHRIVIGDRGLKEGQVEYQARTAASAETVALADIVSIVRQAL
ncbi:proline--tRNA ligase [Methylobacillus flagellatus]|uniref:Proline--tRNA ligase n=1 Tax=Methylobacillus flagellatus (strain ATCC 51484 / DSM 6875 / VKM B-1610 / KT) TaxID=265072 RepID=SYP_METFK|nr:proline--tRNA ligase [Methylobacillus flagellatus]Q1H497.1 RecName: Full=Proline--tRNA ligase; AltName: Full=Prolyl-tRNA synthetase; Short=ProRS [Methylobacillus flagellatus KT]ABE48690.1 prolyl-tRNA synthetase [Methylobacillus flagellatus KT]